VAAGDYSVAGGGVIPAGVVALHGGDVQQVLDFYTNLNPDARAAQWAYETGSAEQLATATGGWEQAIDTLGASRQGILDDPNMQAMFASLGEMASGDYNAIGEAELAGLQGQLASGVNRAQSDRAAALRRAGLSGSGMDLGNAPLYTAIGSAGLADVNAQVEIANQQARDAATSQLGAFSMEQQGMLAPFDMAIAGLQADPPTSGYDPYLGLSIDWTMDQQERADRQAEEDRARADEAMDAYLQSQQWGPLEFLRQPLEGLMEPISMLLGLERTGAYRQLPSGILP
jgi:hypothetical protein